MNIRVSFALALSFLFSIRGQAQEQISLEQVIALALEKNYDVKLSRNTAEAASTNDNLAWGGFLPQVNGNASTLWTNNNQKVEFQDANRNNSGVAKSNNIAASVQLNWTLFDGTKMFATRERVSVIAEQGELLVKDQLVNTIASVIVNYYDVVRQQQQLMAIREQMAVNEERVKLAERKLQVGVGGKPELLQARVDYNAQRTLALQQEAIILQLKEQLNALVGLQLPKTYDVADTIVIDLGIRQEYIEQDIESSNFSLLSARKNLDIASLSLWERRAEQIPVVSFNAAYNFTRTNNTQLINSFNTLFGQTDGYNYGFSLTVPILNGLTTRRQIELEKINVSRQQVLYEQQKTVVDIGVRNAYVNYDNAKKVLLIEEENILLAKENVFIALEGFKRGVTTFIELRTAQQSLADAYNRLINARYLAKVAETELLRLKGGLLR
jgi:outer membrane protein